MSPITARAWAAAAPTFADQPDWGRAFAPDGRTPAAGATWRYPDQARTLEAIATSRGEAFYRGALADAIVGHARAQGAVLDAADLADHRADWVGTVSTA